MSPISKFANGSLVHKVTTDSNGFSIWPVDDSAVAIANFQAIAKEAASYSGADFITKPHPDKAPFDMVFFYRNSKEWLVGDDFLRNL